MSFLWRSRRSRNAKKIRVRAPRDVSRHEALAFVAAATAWSTTSGVAKVTSAVCSPVAGLKTRPVRSALPDQALPPIQWVIVFTPPPLDR